MTTKRILLPILTVLLVTMSSFIIKNKTKSSGEVMIYGVMYINKCGREASMTYATKVVSANNVTRAKAEFKSQLEDSYPNASRIRVSSSDFDFGISASNSCVISWTKTNNNCSYKVISVLFGRTEQEALDKAIKHKNTWAGSNTSHTIEKQIYW